MQGPAQILGQVLRILEADRQANGALGNAGLRQVLGGHPEMRRRRRVDHQRLGVADVGEVRKEIQRLDEFASLRPRPAKVERKHRAAPAWQQRLRQLVIGMAGQLGVAYVGNQRMRGEERHDLARVLHMPLHAHRERLDALQDLERGERRHAGAEIADAFAPRPQQEGGGRRLLAEHHVVKAVVGLGERREFPARRASIPIEAAGIHEHAADDDAVTREKFGRGMENQIRAVIERSHEPGRGERRVDQQRHAVLMAPLATRGECPARPARDCPASRRRTAACSAAPPRATRRCRADRRKWSRCRNAAACSRAGCANRRTATGTRRCASPRPAAWRWPDAAPPGRWRWRGRRPRPPTRPPSPRAPRPSDWKCANTRGPRVPC